MLKKEITYEDPFTNEEVTQTFYFNLTKAEITEWEFSVDGGLQHYLTAVVENQNGKEIMAAMKELILKSHGKREGSNFIKNERIREEFESSEPYSALFWELCTDAESAAKFVSSIVPKDMANQEELAVERPNLKESLASDRATLTAVENPRDGVEIRPEPKFLTREELVAMDRQELQSGLAEGRYILSNDAAKID